MPRKHTTIPRSRLMKLYPSLAAGLTPANRQAQLLERARLRGVAPATEDTLDALGEVWPEDEDLDDFLTWLRETRREGKR